MTRLSQFDIDAAIIVAAIDAAKAADVAELVVAYNTDAPNRLGRTLIRIVDDYLSLMDERRHG